MHTFRLVDVADMDDDFITLLQAACAVGQQQQLTRTGAPTVDGAV